MVISWRTYNPAYQAIHHQKRAPFVSRMNSCYDSYIPPSTKDILSARYERLQTKNIYICSIKFEFLYDNVGNRRIDCRNKCAFLIFVWCHMVFEHQLHFWIDWMTLAPPLYGEANAPHHRQEKAARRRSDAFCCPSECDCHTNFLRYAHVPFVFA